MKYKVISVVAVTACAAAVIVALFIPARTDSTDQQLRQAVAQVHTLKDQLRAEQLRNAGDLLCISHLLDSYYEAVTGKPVTDPNVIAHDCPGLAQKG